MPDAAWTAGRRVWRRPAARGVAAIRPGDRRVGRGSRGRGGAGRPPRGRARVRGALSSVRGPRCLRSGAWPAPAERGVGPRGPWTQAAWDRARPPARRWTPGGHDLRRDRRARRRSSPAGHPAEDASARREDDRARGAPGTPPGDPRAHRPGAGAGRALPRAVGAGPADAADRGGQVITGCPVGRRLPRRGGRWAAPSASRCAGIAGPERTDAERGQGGSGRGGRRTAADATWRAAVVSRDDPGRGGGPCGGERRAGRGVGRGRATRPGRTGSTGRDEPGPAPRATAAGSRARASRRGRGRCDVGVRTARGSRVERCATGGIGRRSHRRRARRAPPEAAQRRAPRLADAEGADGWHRLCHAASPVRTGSPTTRPADGHRCADPAVTAGAGQASRGPRPNG